MKKIFLLSIIVIALLWTIITLTDLSRSIGEEVAFAYEIARTEESLARQRLRAFVTNNTSSSWTKEDYVTRQCLADEAEASTNRAQGLRGQANIFGVAIPIIGIATSVFILISYAEICIKFYKKQKRRRGTRPAL